MDALAAVLERRADRVLGQPVDLQIGVERAQLVGDGDVPPDVAESDRRGHVQRSLRTPIRARPATKPWRRSVEEVAQREVDAHGIAGLRAVSRPSEADKSAAGELGRLGADGVRHDAVVLTVDHQHRAAHPSTELACPRGTHSGHVGRDERLGVGLAGPPHAVLGLLGGVRLVEDLAKEELEKSDPIATPRVCVVPMPSFVNPEVRVKAARAPHALDPGPRARGTDQSEPAPALDRGDPRRGSAPSARPATARR